MIGKLSLLKTLFFYCSFYTFFFSFLFQGYFLAKQISTFCPLFRGVVGVKKRPELSVEVLTDRAWCSVVFSERTAGGKENVRYGVRGCLRAWTKKSPYAAGAEQRGPEPHSIAPCRAERERNGRESKEPTHMQAGLAAAPAAASQADHSNQPLEAQSLRWWSRRALLPPPPPLIRGSLCSRSLGCVCY